MQQQPLTAELLGAFGAGRIFRDNSAEINTLDFRSDGQVLITGSLDQSLRVYDIKQGVLKKTLTVKAAGVGVVRYTHHPNAVIVASNNNTGDDAIRYLSLYDNRYLREFKGHTNKVVSLTMSPIDDNFISASLDSTIRLWNLSTNVCQGCIRVPEGPCFVAYESQGLVFAIATAGNLVKLYDVKKKEEGPFLTITIPGPPLTCTQLVYSADGNYLLFNTDNQQLFLLDAFSTKVICTYTSHATANEQKSKLSACFSADSKFVLCGSNTGAIHVWDLAGNEVAVWSGDTQPTTQVMWCPNRLVAVSASTRLAFWIPDFQRLRDQQNAASLKG